MFPWKLWTSFDNYYYCFKFYKTQLPSSYGLFFNIIEPPGIVHSSRYLVVGSSIYRPPIWLSLVHLISFTHSKTQWLGCCQTGEHEFIDTALLSLMWYFPGLAGIQKHRSEVIRSVYRIRRSIQFKSIGALSYKIRWGSTSTSFPLSGTRLYIFLKLYRFHKSSQFWNMPLLKAGNGVWSPFSSNYNINK